MLILKWVAFLINWAALGTWFLSWHVPFFLPLCESKYLADTKEGCRTKKHFENVSVQLWIEVPYILKGRRRCNGSRRWTAALLGANRCSKRTLAFSEYISIFSPLEFYILWRFVFLKYLLVLRFTDCNLVPSTTPISSVCWAAPLIYETDFRSILILSLSPRGLIMLISSSTLLFLGYSTISALNNSQFILL